MAYPAGSRFGPFEILSLLGAGGMGEVYRARDARLNRDVALKVLPEAFTANPERLARFTREAQVLASLNHTNIGGIHGLEDAQGRQALVLELVEGPTLADRIAQGAVPLDEALPIARQIAEALEAAHEQGVVHRDLKPANIKVRPDGTVKVLDFGLAKALARNEESGAIRPDVTASPTLLSPATMTSAGIILGTAAYMAPEQARGKAVDRRADIWAFGCVLYEMLTGRRTFEGDEVTDTLAGILRGEPAWDALPPTTPPAISRLLRRCLEKDPRQRLQAIGDARIEIAEALSGPPEETTPAAAAGRSPRANVATPMLAAVAAALLVGGAMWAARPSESEVGVTRSLIEMNAFDHRPPAKPGERPRFPIRPDRTGLALSPDGRTLVFWGVAVDVNPGGGTQSVLFVRPLDGLAATPIRTTTGSESPFFSPDGASIGYWDAAELRRVPVTGSTTATTITRVPGEVAQPRVMGASWGDGDVIVFSAGGDLWKVAASGGSPEPIVKKRDDEYSLRLPHVLPGGQAMLFTRLSTAFRWDDSKVVVRSLDTDDQKVLLDDAADARYVSTGHIVFLRRGKLMAVPFDPESRTLLGGAVAIVDDVMQAANMTNAGADSGAGQVAVSAAGHLVYVTGGTRPDDHREFVWVSRDGQAEPIPAPRNAYVSGRLSPDGEQIVTFTNSASGQRVWVYDLTRGTLTPLAPQQERAAWGVFSPDGARIAFQSVLAGRDGVSLRASDGTGAGEPIDPASRGVQSPSSWSTDDKIAFVQSNEQTRNDIWVYDVRTRKASAAVQTDASESHPALSSDGRWLAYVSDLSGRSEVYVQPYPGPGPRIQVSNGGGTAPAWTADGGELFYATQADGGGLSMMAVKVTPTGSMLSAGVPQELFKGLYGQTTPVRGWDVSADGRRFLFVRAVDPPPPPPTQMVLVQNFGEELERRAPAGTQKQNRPAIVGTAEAAPYDLPARTETPNENTNRELSTRKRERLGS
jgi:serine/threonine-protein kinase